MEDKNIQSKIIKQVCKEVLIPLGVFQKGTSRLYIDDNGYFFTIIEFQPSSWNKGTYLNIGLTFLWDSNQSDVLYFGFSRQPAARYGKFVEYQNEMQFKNEVTALANVAKKEILFYRKLRDTLFAKDWLISYANKYDDDKYARFGLALADICALNHDTDSAKFYYEKYRKEQNTENKIDYKNINFDYLTSNIAVTRKMWHNKPSMKNMPFSPVHDI